MASVTISTAASAASAAPIPPAAASAAVPAGGGGGAAHGPPAVPTRSIVGAAAWAEPTAPAVRTDSGDIYLSLAILMDCTGSMGAWISAAKQQVMRVVTTMHARYDRATLRVAFVGYRDFKDEPRFVVVPFTTDITGLRGELERVAAFGGDDAAEDVAGGLDQVRALDWRRDEGGNINSIVHVCDAPCHGQRYHDILLSDAYPRGDPSGRNPEALIRELASRGIDYTFINITKDTDQMVRLFKTAYDAGAVSDQQSFTVLDLVVQTTTPTTGTVGAVSTVLPRPLGGGGVGVGGFGMPPSSSPTAAGPFGVGSGIHHPATFIAGPVAAAAMAAVSDDDPMVPSPGMARGAGSGAAGTDPRAVMSATPHPAAAPAPAPASTASRPVAMDPTGRAVFATTEDAMYSVLTTSLTRSIAARATRPTPATGASGASPSAAPSGGSGGGAASGGGTSPTGGGGGSGV